MPQETAKNEKETTLSESENQKQAAVPLSSKEQNLQQSSNFWKKTTTYLGISAAFAAAAALLRSDKGISYAQHVWHFAKNLKRSNESIPITPNSKETALGAATTFATTLATEYSWDYLTPHKQEQSKTNDKTI